jgi:hypothetical protein
VRSPRRFAAALVFVLPFVAALACKPQPKPRPAAPAGEPQVPATVLTITTILQPENKTYTHTLTIAGKRARSGDELDHWRLFDLGTNEVTFVDDVAKTWRRIPMKDLIAQRKDAGAEPLPDAIRADFAITKETQTLQGVEAKKSVITLGGYQRQLWIGSHPLIPPGLFAMMEASRPAATPIEGLTRDADAALFEIKGFPLTEHAELPYGGKKLILDRTVTKIEQRNVPASWLNVRGDYRNLTPPARR